MYYKVKSLTTVQAVQFDGTADSIQTITNFLGSALIQDSFDVLETKNGMELRFQLFNPHLDESIHYMMIKDDYLLLTESGVFAVFSENMFHDSFEIDTMEDSNTEYQRIGFMDVVELMFKENTEVEKIDIGIFKDMKSINHVPVYARLDKLTKSFY